MEANNKNIEAIIDKLMSADSLEQPSLDFTDKVMSKVNAISNSSVTMYKPLIPKSVWFVIVGAFIALVGYIYLNEPTTNSTWLDGLEISNPLENVSFNFSTTFMYAVVLLAIMLSIQVPFLKYYFNKRMSF
jgi:hypothetical protein